VFLKNNGISQNSALISANKYLTKWYDVDLFKLCELDLPADPRGRTYTPTQLGEMLDPKLSPQKVNMILYKMGYQTLDAQRNWVPTDKAKGLYEFYDVAKTTDSGVPIKQLKWFSVMFDHIMNFIASSRQQPVIAPPQAPNLFGTSTQH
jgi:hypothetical protein